MALRLQTASIRAYDYLKQRPGANPRRSDARDSALLEAIMRRIQELISSYRIGENAGVGGGTYVFWVEISREIDRGAFDDLLPLL